MTPERWQVVRGILQSAMELHPDERDAFLDRECAADPSLRKDVDEYLSVEGKLDPEFLESPAANQVGPPSTTVAGNMRLAPGTRVGPYEVQLLLGAGGMGEVYRAHDSKLGRDVAIKTLPGELARDPERLARFRREARTLASLNHPNIAAIYGLEEFEDADYLVLELVEGETLHGALPVETALDRGCQVAAALEAAHDKGIIHRDLKPANVKVTPQGRVKVLDFGLAKAIWEPGESQDLSQLPTVTGVESGPGQIVGTPGYMSPEQARGGFVDKRTDIWAFGCLLYELLAGKRAFAGETLPDAIAAVLEREPDWHALPAKTPKRIRELLRQCLQKDAGRRLTDIADARTAIEKAQHGWNRWRVVAIATAAVALLVVGTATWWRGPARQADRSQWVQLTKLSDSVTQPALSPDGRMLAFIRGYSSFVGPGQIYVKILPDGQPVQLTHDNLSKMSPVFSPDGSRIAYTTADPEFHWDTSVVPTLGGAPQPLLQNASGLTWTGPGRVLFSEIKSGVQMGIVAAQENRIGARDIYLPATDAAMVHRSYASPDGKSVLLVEMDEDHNWLPCRMVPMDGSTRGRYVGPLGGGCTSAAWTPEGKWMYFTSDHGGVPHIWRQRFPDGRPEQVTSGPTEEEGIAMAPDGRSFLTAVSVGSNSLWVHDAKGERQVSLEGNGLNPRFTPDGKKLCYMTVIKAPNEFFWYRNPGELRVVDLESGRSEPLVPGLPVLEYDISADGRRVVMSSTDGEGKPRLWVMPFDRSSPPVQIPKVEGTTPVFGPDGEIFFRHLEGKTEYVYRVQPDGSGLRKALTAPVFLGNSVSPDGRWIVAWAPIGGNGRPSFQVFPLNGGTPIQIGNPMYVSWPLDGRSVLISGFLIPLKPGEILPTIPAGGFQSPDEVGRLPGAHPIEADVLGPSADVYAFYKSTVQRNLYRIPIP